MNNDTPRRRRIVPAVNGTPQVQDLLARLSRKTVQDAQIDEAIRRLDGEGATSKEIRTFIRKEFAKDITTPAIRKRLSRMSKRKPTRDEFLARWVPELAKEIGETATLESLLEEERNLCACLGRMVAELAGENSAIQDRFQRLGGALLYDPAVLAIRADLDAILLRIGRMTVACDTLSRFYAVLFDGQSARRPSHFCDT